MRKLCLAFLVTVILISGAAQAQKKKLIPPAVRTPQTVIIQDAEGEGFMFFDLATGAYKCKLCEYGYSFNGTGEVKSDGCLVIFSAAGTGYTMTAYVSLCDQQAKCIIQVSQQGGMDVEPWEEVLSDPDVRDSEATCGEISLPPPDLPSEIMLQNDADGSFLLLAPATGEFKFIHCADNTAMSGTGKVSRTGSWLNFEVFATEYRVVASVNLEFKTGKAAIDVFAPFGEMKPMQELISDSDFTDNVSVCGARSKL
jgi:hypothetical protein